MPLFPAVLHFGENTLALGFSLGFGLARQEVSPGIYCMASLGALLLVSFQIEMPPKVLKKSQKYVAPSLKMTPIGLIYSDSSFRLLFQFLEIFGDNPFMAVSASP